MKRLNISSVLLASVALAIVVAVGGIIVYVSASTNRMALEYERQAMGQSASAARQALDLYVGNAEASVLSLSSQRLVREAFTDDTTAAGRHLQAVLQANPDFWTILIFDAQGKVRLGYNADGKDLAGGSRTDRDYCQAILGGQETYLGKTILVAKSGGAHGYIFTAAKAIHDTDGKLLGGVAVFPRWTSFTDQFIAPLHFGKQGYAFMLDASGRFVAHGGDPELVLKDESSEGFVQEILARKDGELFYSFQGKEKLLTFATDPKTGFVVCASAFVDDLTAAANAQRTMLMLIGAGVVAILCAAIFWMLRKLVVRPILDIQAFTSAIHKGDFSAVLHTRFRFELAALADDIRNMVARLKERLGFAQGVLSGFVLPCAVFDRDNKATFVNQYMLDALARPGKPDDYLGQTSGQLVYDEPGRQTLTLRALQEKRLLRGETEYVTKAGAHKIFDVTSTPFNDLDGHLLGTLAVWFELTEVRAQQAHIEEQNQRIAKAAAAADGVSDQVASASEELAAQIEQSSRGSEEQRERTAEAATAMEEMNATVMEVARNAGTAAEYAENARGRAQEGAKLVEHVVSTIADARAQAEALQQDMGTLGSQAQGIGQILDVITDIADQTNLLALNAAIEAARAGDAGRGFAVVADEVRKLAEKTMQATNEVARSIHSIQESAQRSIRKTGETAEAIDAGTKLVQESGAALHEIVGMVDNTSDQVRAIATASEQQSAASEEISRSTEDITRIASETAEAMIQSSQAVTELAQLAHQLKTIIADMNTQG